MDINLFIFNSLNPRYRYIGTNIHIVAGAHRSKS